MYRPVQIKVITYTNNTTRVKETSHITYLNHDGIWFPQKKVTDMFKIDKNKKDWQLFHRRFWTVLDDFKLNVALPNSLFEYEYR